MRLLSYNIHKGIGGRDRRYRLERIIQVIEAENPDLICLQEVDRHVARSRHDDQPRKLSEALDAKAHLYQLNVRFKGGRLRQSRPLALAVAQLVTRSRFDCKRRKPRGAQLAVVDSPEGPLHLVHWHLGLAERERHWQVRHLLDHSRFHESAHLPTLIVGDFNDWLNTLARGPFAAHGFTQVTAPRSRFRSFPGLLAGGFSRQGVRARPVLDPPRPDRPLAAGRDASDHLPLVVDFHLHHRAKATKARDISERCKRGQPVLTLLYSPHRPSSGIQ